MWEKVTSKLDINIILSFFVFILIVFGVYLCYENTVLRTSIKSVQQEMRDYAGCKTEVEMNLKEQSVIIESLIRQEERDITFVLWYIPLLFVIFTGVSYFAFLDKATRLTDDIKKDYEIERQNIQNIGHELSSVQIQLYEEIGQMRESNGNAYLLKKDYSNYIKSKLQALTHIAMSYLFYKDSKEDDKLKACTIVMIRILNEMVQIIEVNKNISIEKDFLYKETNQIRRTENSDIIELLVKIENGLKRT